MKKRMGKALEKAIKGGDMREERLPVENPLLNRQRSRIYSFLTFRPLSSFSSAARHLGVNVTTIRWHVEKLWGHGFVSFYESLPYPSGLVDARDLPLLRALGSSAGTIFFYVVKNPGLTLGEIHKQVGFSYSRTSALVSELENLGLVARVKDGHRTRVYPTELYRERMENQHTVGRKHVENLISRLRAGGIDVEVVKRGDLTVLVLRKGRVATGLNIWTNPFLSLLEEFNKQLFERDYQDPSE